MFYILIIGLKGVLIFNKLSKTIVLLSPNWQRKYCFYTTSLPSHPARERAWKFHLIFIFSRLTLRQKYLDENICKIYKITNIIVFLFFILIIRLRNFKHFSCNISHQRSESRDGQGIYHWSLKAPSCCISLYPGHHASGNMKHIFDICTSS